MSKPILDALGRLIARPPGGHSVFWRGAQILFRQVAHSVILPQPARLQPIPIYHTVVNVARSKPFPPHLTRSIHFARHRPQAIPHRSTHAVGLQNARNFSSGQPIFESLYNNAPLLHRAVVKQVLDLDYKQKKAAKRVLRPASTIATFPSVSTNWLKSSQSQSYFVTPQHRQSNLAIIVEAQTQVPDMLTLDESTRILSASVQRHYHQFITRMHKREKRIQNLYDRLNEVDMIEHASLRDGQLIWTVSPAFSLEDVRHTIDFWLDGLDADWLTLVDFDDMESTSSHDDLSSTNWPSHDNFSDSLQMPTLDFDPEYEPGWSHFGSETESNHSSINSFIRQLDDAPALRIQ